MTKKERKSSNVELESGSGQFGRAKRSMSIHITLEYVSERFQNQSMHVKGYFFRWLWLKCRKKNWYRSVSYGAHEKESKKKRKTFGVVTEPIFSSTLYPFKYWQYHSISTCILFPCTIYSTTTTNGQQIYIDRLMINRCFFYSFVSTIESSVNIKVSNGTHFECTERQTKKGNPTV